MSKLANLDLLRTLAILLVLLDHLLLASGIPRIGPFDSANIGVFGVYLFFVHTSLVLMWSLERRPNVLDFYIRRLFRIYPLSIAAILIAVATHAPVGWGHLNFFDSNHTFRIKQIILNLGLLNEIVGNQPLVLGVTWSLGSEVAMYVLLPCLFFFAHQVRRIWPFLVLWLLAVLYAHRIFPHRPDNLLPTVLPDFLAGIVAYVGFMRRKPSVSAVLFVPLLLLLLFVYIACPSYLRADWVLTLLLGLALPYFRQLRSPALHTTCHQIATYSYGVYLLHPFALVIAFHLLPHLPFAVQLALFLLLTAGFSFAAYHLIEQPCIQLGARLARRAAHERGLPGADTLRNLEPAP